MKKLKTKWFTKWARKNEKDNISSKELEYLRKLGKDLLGMNDQQLEIAIENKALQ